MNLVPNKQLLLNVAFQLTKYRKKELCVDNKVRETIGDSEMCIVQHVEIKSLFTFQPIKRLVSTTVKRAKPAATFWIFLLRSKNRQYCCLAVTVHVVCNKDESWLRKRKAISIFEEISPPITTKHSRTWTIRGQIQSKYGINVSVSYWLMIWAIF